MSHTESFRASREALVLRLRDQEKLSFQQIGDRFDRSDCRAAQIYQAARRKIQFPPNGLSNRLNRLLTLSGFTVEKTPSPSLSGPANSIRVSCPAIMVNSRTVTSVAGLALIPRPCRIPATITNGFQTTAFPIGRTTSLNLPASLPRKPPC